MGAFRILTDNNWPEAVITASSETTALPAEASQHPDRSYVWRSETGTADQQLTIVTAAPVAATMIAIANFRRINDGAIKLQEAGSGSTPGSWTDVATLPDGDDLTKVSIAFFTETTAKHWRLYFTNGTPLSSSYAEVGYVGLGEYFEPVANIRGGFDIVHVDPSVITGSVDGQQTGTARSQFNVFPVKFGLITPADVAEMNSIYRSISTRTLAFLTLDASLDWSWFLGRLRTPLVRTPLDGGNFALSAEFEEAR